MASSDVVRQMDKNARPLALSGHVGFDSLPDQLVNKSTSQGFCFNILCIGETGIGKSTLMDTLFNTNFENFESSHFEPKVKLRAQTYDLQESNVRLKLTVVNTVGFGDQMNKQQRRSSIQKCSLRRIIIKSLNSRSVGWLSQANLITCTIMLFQGHLPFAVVGSTEEVSIGNKMVKARQYPWGVVQVENENHCDFVKLREMLICVNTEDLREQTHTRHYELYRRCKLEEMGFRDTDPECKPVRFLLGFSKQRKNGISANNETLQSRTHSEKESLKHAQISCMHTMQSSQLSACVCTVNSVCVLQLQGKFEQLKRMHAEEKSKLEEKRRSLEEEMSIFSKRRAASELLQAQAFNTSSNNKKDKDRKNSGFM
ncbi:septin-10 [Sinocyclocheilus rhinocerous]|uniref:septin-10 n=1 Tax=Sinocyclocheilus rhinocerous TaxID=307959 RepID=UPI0007B9E5F5|nr:PREDICTED: septin-11-like [Sinocyclocheilus rhinocerous]